MNICGKLLLEYELMPKSVAESYPVGLGREEPNKNPFLPQVLINRNIIDWPNFANTIKSVSAGYIKKIKIIFIICIILIIIGFILYLSMMFT